MFSVVGMRVNRCVCSLSVMGLLLVVVSHHGLAEETTGSDTNAVPPEVVTLIRQLGHDDFAEREKASAALIKIGPPAIGALQEAAKGEDPEIRIRAKKILTLYGLGERELHVVGCYSGDTGFGQASRDHEQGKAKVRVTNSINPIVLVLTAYEPVEWEVKVEGEAVLDRVILSGAYEQTVKGLPADTKVERHIGKNKDPKWFYLYSMDDPESSLNMQRLRGITGMDIASFQGQYTLQLTNPINVPPPVAKR
jgi:hypothetical protein